MLMSFKSTLLVGALGAVVGCTGPLVESGGFKVQESALNEAVAKIKPRAAFDLSCGQEQIQLVVLAVARGQMDTAQDTQPKQIGASGCGKKAVYIDVLDNGDWVLNSK
jgi:hypothetical protein